MLMFKPEISFGFSSLYHCINTAASIYDMCESQSSRGGGKVNGRTLIIGNVCIE